MRSNITNNKALAPHSRAKRHTKTGRKKRNNKEWDKAEGKERVSQMGTQKRKNKGKTMNESRKRARGGLIKNKAGQLM